jgi:2-amino-4-hydroxy-6-hydroxymethyldihydropteridine diphosphokinase
VALGGNLGDRAGLLNQAIALLRECAGIQVHKVSSFHETFPVGGPLGQGKFINAVIQIDTDLPAAGLLALLHEVETRLGRVRKERSGPRTIDLDLLLFGDLVVDTPGLSLPHPRMLERAFVLEPLAELAPEAIHPTTGRTVGNLLVDLRAREDATVRPGRELGGIRAAVTGSTSGIGRAIALELAAAGADVVVHGRRFQAAAEEVTDLCRAQRTNAHWVLADLRDEAECRRLADTAWREWDGLDLWVNNAGADTLTAEAAGWPFERKWQELFALDVTGTMLLSRTIGGLMKKRGRGAIINMGWDQAETGMEGDSGQLFAAAKGAVMAFTKSLAVTLAPQVRVNCVAPGWTRTAWGGSASAHWQERVVRETPLARWGTPEDVAGVVRWLAGPGASFVTGQIIRVNGGAVR